LFNPQINSPSLRRASFAERLTSKRDMEVGGSARLLQSHPHFCPLINDANPLPIANRSPL